MLLILAYTLFTVIKVGAVDATIHLIEVFIDTTINNSWPYGDNNSNGAVVQGSLIAYAMNSSLDAFYRS